MLRRVSRLRKLIQQGVQSAPSIAYETPPVSVPSTSYRQISNLPKDYATVKVVMPVRTVRNADPHPPQSATGSEKSSQNIASGATTASAMQQGAQTATSWMFPWEKRQMDGRGTPLRTWEKLYWGVFVTAISLFLFNRLKPDPVEAKVDEDKEARKLEAARAVLAGRSFTEGEEDPFEGLGPQEIQAYIDKALQGVSHSDPFEGMTPEEINEYTAKNGVPAQYQ